MRKDNGTGSLGAAAMVAAVAAALFLYRFKVKADTEKSIERINRNFDETTASGKEELERVLRQWSDAKRAAESFDAGSESKVVVA